MLTSNSTDLVRKDSIQEMCGHRARALELYALAHRTLIAAQEAHRRAAAGKQYISDDFLKDLHRKDLKDMKAETIRRAIDRDMWNGFIIGTPLGSLMDEQERKSFAKSLEECPPEVTPETVFATMARLAGDGEKIFRRGLVEVFRHLSRDYQSHNGFKIGDRLVLTGMVTNYGAGWYNMNHYREGTLQDLDRCFHVLDGKPAPEYQQGLLAAFRTSLAAKDGTNEFATEYYRVRWFKNGNAHVWFIRPDLVERANRLIADHFGEALGVRPGAKRAA